MYLVISSLILKELCTIELTRVRSRSCAIDRVEKSYICTEVFLTRQDDQVMTTELPSVFLGAGELVGCVLEHCCDGRIKYFFTISCGYLHQFFHSPFSICFLHLINLFFLSLS